MDQYDSYTYIYIIYIYIFIEYYRFFWAAIDSLKLYETLDVQLRKSRTLAPANL